MSGRILLVLAMVLMPFSAFAQDSKTGPVNPVLEDQALAIIAVLEGRRPAEEVFSPAFLAEIPASRLVTLSDQLEAQFGAIQGMEEVIPLGPSRARIIIRFERALGGGPFQLDANGLISGLLFNTHEPINDSADKITADLAALPGNVSILLTPLDASRNPVLALRENEQFAIGSTFKLYVLSALAHAIEEGKYSWSDIVRLDTRSLPSGIMQNWPAGSPVTIHTLATMMVSASDNTATDQLIKLLGRDAVEREIYLSNHSNPARTLPLLTTLELFGLKGDPARAEGFVTADEKDQYLWLERFAQEIDGDPARIIPPRFASPHAIDTLEWFASGEDLRQLMQRIVAMPDPTAREIMAVAPALPEPSRKPWRYIGYKGGSEPGVLNLTWLLQDKSGEWHVLAMSWNNPDAVVSHEEFELLATRLLALLQNQAQQNQVQQNQVQQNQAQPAHRN